MIVADASVIVKLLVEEPGSDLARYLLAGYAGDIHVPSLLLAEVAAVLVRLANSDMLAADMALALLEKFLALVETRTVVLHADD